MGVTGTNGKTTTTFLLHAMLVAAGRAPGLVGTVEWIVGGERRGAPFTTPEAIDLQRLFRELLDAGDRSVVIEASSHGSALMRLDRVRFAALVFTNLSQDHLDLHGTMEEYFQAKRRLFAGAQPPPAAVGVGDEWGRRLASELAESHRAPLVTFGLDAGAEVWAEGLEVGPWGSRFRAAGMALETPLRGLFNVENALGAVAAGLLLDLDEDAIAEGLAAVSLRARPLRAGRRGAAVLRRRRLLAHARLARDRAARGAWALRRPRARRLRGRRRPRPREAAAHGTGCGRARGSRDRDLRQPALRGSARDHHGRAPGRRRGRRDRSRPALGHPPRDLARAARATSCSSPARATSRVRRSPASSIPSTTEPSLAKRSPRSPRPAECSWLRTPRRTLVTFCLSLADVTRV